MLEKIRKLYGFTQVELAEKVGTRQNYYTLVETGTTKSGPLIKKLSDFLKIKESFLTLSPDFPPESIEYPFTSDFYIFCIREMLLNPYTFILDYLCQRSSRLDIVFLLWNPEVLPLKTSHPASVSTTVLYIALKDDRETVFLMKREVKEKKATSHGGYVKYRFKTPEIHRRAFGNENLFRRRLYSFEQKSVAIYERTIVAPTDLAVKIENGTVGREDVLDLFPTPEYFKYLYETHLKKEKR